MKRVLFILLGLAAAAGAGVGLVAVTRHPTFRLREVLVLTASARLPQEELVRLAGVRQGEGLLTLSLKKVRRNLLQSPWIQEVAVARSYPGRLILSVTGQEPVALIRLDGLYLVGRDGEIFKKVEGEDPRNFPIITGLASPSAIRIARSLKLIRLFRGLTGWRELGLSEVHWGEREGVALYTERPVVRIRLGNERWEERLANLARIFPEIGRREKAPASVDLTYDNRIFVREKV